MATMIIMLRRDPQSGKQNIIIKLDSDSDTLPMEHENMHRELVQKLIGRGLDPEELGEIIVERDAAPEPAAGVHTEPPAERRPQGQGQ